MRANVYNHMVPPPVRLRATHNVAAVIIDHSTVFGQLAGERCEPAIVKIFDTGIAHLVSASLSLEVNLRNSAMGFENRGFDTAGTGLLLEKTVLS